MAFVAFLKILRTAVSLAGILASVFGLYFNAAYLVGLLNNDRFASMPKDGAPYFVPAYILMTSAAVIATALVLLCSIRLFRSQTWLSLLVKTLVFEFLLMFITGMVWLVPFGIGRSVGAATGVSLGGLSPQIFVLLPLALILLWLNGRVEDSSASAKV